MIVLQTNYGNISLELDTQNAPNTAKNFLEHAKNGYYDDTIFHRVIEGFMIQGGGMESSMQEKARKTPIKNEANNKLSNKRGTIAMARTSDPHSASTQFFINVKDNNFLDYKDENNWGYCVFGKVTEGMDIVDKINKAQTTFRSGHQDVPVEPIVLEKVLISEQSH
jgi:peptidyl-prolyl cis-trans isomerase B (cyclophilin B)